ncbi:MAG TPA: hypothetical protein VLZ72_04200 [Flavobacterium sp.]|nr:hypothetical protein [Flavobacterium sp.]
MTEEQLQKEIKSLWEIVSRLERDYSNSENKRKFTIDGHLLGSIGEVYAKEKFNLILLPNSEKTHDAYDPKTKENYQIKITQRNKVGIRHKPENLIVIKIENDGLPKIIYKGKGEPVWEKIKHKLGEQKFIYLGTLQEIKENTM